MATCVECQRLFPQEDLAFFNRYGVCAQCKPSFLQRMIEGAAPDPATGLAWRSGRQMVTRPGAVLPDRCVRCNAPAHGFRIKRKLYVSGFYHRRQAVIHVGLCDKHRRLRRWTIISCWLAALVWACLEKLADADPLNFGDNVSAIIAVSGFVLFLGTLVYAALTLQVVFATKIEDQFVWVKQAGQPFLEELPEWTGP